MPAQPVQVLEFPDTDSQERAFWAEALEVMKASGTREALAKLLTASDCAPSVRARNRYRLLMARLCLEAERPDLARPIMEELNHLIEELHLERWESPRWIAEVLEALYQCLTRGQPSDEDLSPGEDPFSAPLYDGCYQGNYLQGLNGDFGFRLDSPIKLPQERREYGQKREYPA